MVNDDASPTDVRAQSERRWIPATLIAVATVVAVLSTLTTWVRTELLDTDQWVGVSSDLLAEPEIQEALTTYLSNELFERVDVSASLAELLPDQLSQLAGPLSAALREPVTNGIGRIIASDRFATLWENANRAAHERMVAILRDETGPLVSTSDGTVTLELGDALRTVGESIGLPQSVLDRLPPDAGQVVIFESDELSSMQQVVQLFDFLSWFLFVVVIGLYALAVALARGRRIVVLRNVGLAMAAGGLTLLILRALGIRALVGQVIDNPAREPIGEIVASIATELLRQASWVGIVYGLLIAGFALLIGEHRWAVRVRSILGRVSGTPGAAIAIGVIGVLVLLWWSPGRVFDRWVTALAFVALVIAAMVTLLVIVARERRAASAGAGDLVP